MGLQLDHITFGAANLADGIEYMSKLLGVPPIGGGNGVMRIYFVIVLKLIVWLVLLFSALASPS